MQPPKKISDSDRPRADLRRKVVFLSASFPSAEQSPKDYETADAAEISQAIVAVVRGVLAANGCLVLGGHPTVTPLVLMVAQEYLPEEIDERLSLAAGLPVVIYQSEIFKPYLADSTKNLFDWHFGDARWTPKAENETPRFTPSGRLISNTASESLKKMRTTMLHETKPCAAFFIGGMEGIRDEANLCREFDRNCRLFFVGAPGGAARRLSESFVDTSPTAFNSFAKELHVSQSYPALVQNLIRLLAEPWSRD